MKTNVVLAGVVCAFALVGAQRVWAEEKDEKPVTLAQTYKEGDAQRYKIEIQANVSVGDVTITQTNKVTVKEVKKTGDIVLVRTDEGGTFAFGGQEQPTQIGPPVTVTRDKMGRQLDFKHEEIAQNPFSPSVELLNAQLNELLLPDKPVKPKDTWQTELDNPVVEKKKIIVKGTFLGTEKVMGVELWKVKQTAEAVVDPNGSKCTTETTFWLDPANGHIIKMENDVKGIPTIQYGTMSWIYKMAAIKPGDEKKGDEKKAPVKEAGK
jgi:hypothetical protein